MQLTDWQCRPVAPGAASDPDALDLLGDDGWLPVSVPGTAAAALALAWEATRQPARLGHPATGDDPDRWDWWFRCRVPEVPPGARHRLHFGGLATLCDVWWNGAPILSTDNMFRSYQVDLDDPHTGDELLVRCSSVQAALDGRKGRPRWRTDLVAEQKLRLVRTTLFGRQPGWTGERAPVGPWRPVELRSVPPVAIRRAALDATATGTGGRVDVDIELETADDPSDGAAPVAVASCAGVDAPLSVTWDDGWRLRGSLEIEHVDRWWPATHGAQPLYPVTVTWAGTEAPSELGSVGFRTLDVGPANAPVLTVNDIPIFARGVCWTPVDPTSLAPGPDRLRQALEQCRDAGLNLVRVTGTGVYETEDFHRLCDELGLLVWQDLMFARMDYPLDDPDFAAGVAAELGQLADRLRGHPSTALVCGGTEVAQQVAMLGRDVDLSTLVGARVEEQVRGSLPDVAYVADTPSGGTHPFTVDTGFAHYFGVGGYRRPLTDARTCGVRFASECLAFSHVPGDAAVEDLLAGGHGVGDPTWSAGIPRDRGTPWDFEDVRDHYVRELFGVDPVAVRAVDPEWYLDLGRAAGSIVVSTVLSEWRRPASTCRGAILLEARDNRPGAGAGVVDHRGRPKASWFALARTLSPMGLLLVDEGLNGLDVWALNDTDQAVAGTLVVRAFSSDALVAEGRVPVTLDGHDAVRLRAEAVLGTFLDLTDAFRFGPSAIAGVVATWESDAGDLARASFRPRPRGAVARIDLGLEAQYRPIAEDVYEIDVSARRFAHFVLLECGDATLSDDGFDIEPGGTVTITARTSGTLRARARALTSDRSVAVVPAGA